MATLLESYKGKTTGSTLTASEWNNCLTAIETGITQASLTGSSSSSGSSSFTTAEENILKSFADNNIEYSGSDSNNLVLKSAKHVNVESASGADIQMKPGDDISFMSHHRVAGKLDKVSTKIVQHSKVPSVGSGSDATTAETKEMDHPVEWEVNAANLTFTTVDKDDRKVYDTLMYDSAGDTVPNTSSGNQVDDESNDEIFNVKINTGKSGVSDNKKGYLKVRARAIDLRCEEHGGIALQPYGSDSEGSENKIKFEHGGGDGLEFGTFNTEKTSIFTDEYRFNKDGVWKMATRTKEVSDKYATGEETTHYKYKKNTKGTASDIYETGDDFYDYIDKSDEQCTTNALIKTGNAFNGGKDRHAKVTSSGNVEIQTNKTYHFVEISGTPSEQSDIPAWVTDLTTIYNSGDLTSAPEVGSVYKQDEKLYQWQEIESPEIKIQAGSDVTIKSDSDDVILEAGDAIKMSGDEIRLTGTTLVSFNTTPKVVFLSSKFKASAKFDTSSSGTVFVSGSLNNTVKDVYVTSAGIWKYPVDNNITFYTDEACTTLYAFNNTKKAQAWYKKSNDDTVYTLDGTQEHFYVVDSSNNLWHVEYSEDGYVKKNPENIGTFDGTSTYTINETYATDYTGTEFVNYDYTSDTETKVAAGEVAGGTGTCYPGDIITLVNWFKDNSLGPWNTDTTTGGIKNA